MNLGYSKNRSTEFNELHYWLYRKGNSCEIYNSPAQNADEVIFTFWKINNFSWDLIEKECLKSYKVNPHEEIFTYDYFEMKMIFLRSMFRSWSFQEEMTFDEEGKLDDNSFQKLLHLHPAILRELTGQLFDYTLTEEDEIQIAQQSHFLFAKHTSVMNPHRMISLYCTLAEMWDKFGLNYFDLMKLPLYEKNALKKILSFENQIRSSEIQQMEAKSKSNSNKVPLR